jgi:uncharacterized membrane protein
MAFCKSCGTQLADGASFCSACGTSQTAAATPTAAAAPAQAPAPTAQPAAGMESNLAGALAYILGFITGIIFLVKEPEKNDKFVRFHAFQSIFFSVACIGISIVFGILSAMMFSMGLWSLWWGLLMVLRLAMFVGWLFLMFKAYNKEQFKLPIIGDMAAKQAGV